jgi:hypothetical protein
MSAKNYGLIKHGWPLLFVVGDTEQIPYPLPLEQKSSDLDELQGTIILLWGCSSLSRLPVVASVGRFAIPQHESTLAITTLADGSILFHHRREACHGH